MPSGIQISKYHKCTSIHDSIWSSLQLCHCKFVGKICAPEKSGASQRFCLPESAWLTSGLQFVQVCFNYVETWNVFPFILTKKNCTKITLIFIVTLILVGFILQTQMFHSTISHKIYWNSTIYTYSTSTSSHPMLCLRCKLPEWTELSTQMQSHIRTTLTLGRGGLISEFL